MGSDEERLLERIREGDCAAFAEFYDLHAPRVFGLLIRLLGDRGDAEDVLQETFWQVWRTAGQYDVRRARPQVWLSTIARSRAIDALRRRPARVEVSGGDVPLVVHDPCESLVADETKCRLQAALANLPTEQRTAVTLAFFDGWTHVRIADEQRIPLGTAKTRIALGMKRLRRLLRLDSKERAR